MLVHIVQRQYCVTVYNIHIDVHLDDKQLILSNRSKDLWIPKLDTQVHI